MPLKQQSQQTSRSESLSLLLTHVWERGVVSWGHSTLTRIRRKKPLFFFTQTWEDPLSMQDPQVSFPSITGSCWTLPGSPTGNDGLRAVKPGKRAWEITVKWLVKFKQCWLAFIKFTVSIKTVYQFINEHKLSLTFKTSKHAWTFVGILYRQFFLSKFTFQWSKLNNNKKNGTIKIEVFVLFSSHTFTGLPLLYNKYK